MCFPYNNNPNYKKQYWPVGLMYSLKTKQLKQITLLGLVKHNRAKIILIPAGT